MPMTAPNQDYSTSVQLRLPRRKGKRLPLRMRKRPAKGPNEQRKITLPGHVWELLDRVAQLQTRAYALMAGKTKFQVSDLLESGAEMYLRSLIEELGDMPDENDTRAENEFVKRLADSNKRALIEDLLGSKSEGH
jgi:hypothetical protein